MKNFEMLVDHISANNREGRGHPYSIPRLVKIAERRRFVPRRITIDMRLRLDERLGAAGIRNDKVLDENGRFTRLWV
jgi:hypothetical protein